MSTTHAGRHARPVRGLRHRNALLLLATLTSLAALVGAVQLITDTFTPPVGDLEPLGLHSWVLPGMWLAASVAVPCAAVAFLAGRRSDRAGRAAIVAGVLLTVELAVQVPFVGFDPLQVVMGLVAAALIAFGVDAVRRPLPSRG